MGIDIGGSSRNGIAIVNENEELIYSTNVPYDRKKGVGFHRRAIAEFVRQLIKKFPIEAIVIERVKMHRGKRLSKLADIVSLSKSTAGILDRTFDLCKVYDIETVSWKAQVLGTRSATKEDAVNYIKSRYGIDVPHDEADAICEALYLKRNYNLPENLFHDLTNM